MTRISFRELHDALLNYEGSHPYVDVLLPWLQASTDLHSWIRSINRRKGDPIPSIDEEESWELYALSRVLDVLILGFQDGGADAGWSGPQISVNEFQYFIQALGMTLVMPTTYSAFYHEIVDVRPVEKPSHVPIITKYRWPCVMLGDLLILRAGVELTAGKDILSPSLACNTTLYWAYRRKVRLHQDLSHGWGSNSQWRTSFRRDYVIGKTQFFNVDGKYNLQAKGTELTEVMEARPELTLNERVELLTNRCFVKCTRPHDDLWPYDDRYQLVIS